MVLMAEPNEIEHMAGALVDLARYSFRNEPGSREDFHEGVRFVCEERAEYSSFVARYLIGILAKSVAVMRAAAGEGIKVEPIFLRTGFPETDSLLDQHIQIHAAMAVDGESHPHVVSSIERLNDAYFNDFNLKGDLVITALVQVPKAIAHHESRRRTQLIEWTP